MPVTKLSKSFYNSTNLIEAIDFCRTFTKEQQNIMEIVSVKKGFFIQSVTTKSKKANQFLICTFENGKLLQINFTEILKELNNDLLKSNTELKKYVVQVIERG